MNDLISIIVPAYNIQPYIARCLDSLLAQTYKEIQIIVIDDGSTDGTADVLEEYAKQYSNIGILRQENRGVSSARIAGIKKAAGEYIGFVDGDDWVEPDMFEILINNAVNFQADISHCGYQMDFPDGHSDLYYGSGKMIFQDDEKGKYDFMTAEFVEPGVWNKLYKKSILIDFEKTALWNDSIKINEDVLMNYILFSRAKRSVFEDVCKYHYTLRQNSAATNKRSINQVADPVQVMKIIFEDVKNNRNLKWIAYERYLRTLIMASLQTEWKSEAKKARQELKKQYKSGQVKELSSKMQIMVYMVSYVPAAYKIIRKVYDLGTGNDRKYDVG